MEHIKQKITIGLLRADLHWTLLLDQIGLSWDETTKDQAWSVQDYSVIVINRPMTTSEQSIIDRYLVNGGAVIYSTDEMLHVRKKSSTRRYIRTLPPQAKTEYSFNDVFDLFATVDLFQSDSILTTERIGKGIASFLGIDVKFIMTDNASIRKSFYCDRDRLPHEIVSQRSKSALRQLIQSHLEYLHHGRNLPFIHKWYYPNGASTLFTFRIDTDKGTQSQIDALYKICDEHQIPATWFLDVKSHEDWLSYFNSFKQQEIGVHCYEHVVFNSMILNKENFEKAKTRLVHAGLSPVGITAPTGAWNNQFGKAIQELGFQYSSEFSYDYDNLPSYPILQHYASSVLQLPVHPICVGTMKRERMTVEEMTTYFLAVIDTCLERREPICFYHHPGHEMNEIFQNVFRYITQKKIIKLSYADYAAWWQRRDRSSLQAELDGNMVSLNTEKLSDDAYVRISMPGSREAICAMEQSINLSTMQWNAVPTVKMPPETILRIRKPTWRHYIQNALDWWIKTTE